MSSIAAIQVSQDGTVIVEPIASFEGAGLHPVMLENLELTKFSTPTPIQRYVLPAIFLDKDLIASAQAGESYPYLRNTW